MKKLDTLLVYFGVAIIFILYFITKSIFLLIVGIIFLILVLVLYKFYLAQYINSIKDVEKRIEKLEGIISTSKNGLQKALYLNQLSTCYNEKGENEKALQIVRAAKQLLLSDNDKSRIIIMEGVPMMEVLKLNEANYLIELNQFGEASQLLNDIDDTMIKDETILFSLDLAHASLAVSKGFSDIARLHLNKLQDVSNLRRSNAGILEYHVLLVQAKCDLLEHDTVSAISKLDKIINCSKFPHTVELAMELKNTSGV